MDSIHQAIQEATQNAAALVPATAGGVPSHMPMAAGAPVSVDELISQGGISVDEWLKVNFSGMMIGNSPATFDELTLGLNLADVQGFYGIRYGQHPNTTYKKSYDHVTCTTGGSWADAIREGQRVDPKLREYRGVELPFDVLEDIVDKKGNVLIAAGARLGHSTSITNWANFQKFYLEVKRDGLFGQPLAVKLGHQAMSKGSNRWGLITFESFELNVTE